MTAFKRPWFRPPKTSFVLLSCINLLAFLISASPISDGAHLAQGGHNALGIPPSGSDQPHLADIIARGEINPVAQKFATVPDPDMPGVPDLSPLAKTNLSSYDDSSLQLTSTKPMQGIFAANRPVGNGCVHFYTSTQRPRWSPLYTPMLRISFETH